jgi:trans-aconitate methyltransferase
MSLGMSPALHRNGGDHDRYLQKIRAEIPAYDELQAATVAAIPFPPDRVLELGIGTGETARRLLQAFPEAHLTGLDSSPDMVFRARELVADVRLARMEDPLPDGPWDLVISVLSVHLLDEAQERDLFRRVREQSKSLVIADRFGDAAERLADWCDGEIAWSQDELAVIRADYR